MPATLIITVIAALLVREYVIFLACPRSADAASARGDKDAARGMLEDVLRKPSLFGSALRRHVHHRLSWLYLNERRIPEAVEQSRLALLGRLNPAIEALYLMRLADCLEANGDLDAAVGERARVAPLLNSTRENAAQLIALGSSLRSQGRYTDAIPVYERALAKTPESLTMPRAHIMASLALACWEAGRINETLRWSEGVLALNPDITHRTTVLSISGLALGNLGRLDEAEERHRMAYEASSAVGNTDQAARHLAMVGAMHRRQGRLVEAIETCERAASMSLASRRAARFTEYETFLSWGRFSDAREMLEQGLKAQGFAIVGKERRIQAVSELAQALLEVEEGRADQAIVCLDAARDELADDEKTAISYHSMRAWVEALLGRVDMSGESARRATALSARIPDSRNSLLTYHRNLGCASLAAGRIDSARHHWQTYLSLLPDPVDAPKAHYYLGQCFDEEGNRSGAREEWQAAVDSGLDTLYVSLARERLRTQVSP